MVKIYLKGIEIISSTEQAIVFAKKVKGKEIGASVLLNIMFYESNKEDSWNVNDLHIQKAIELLEGN